jgi:FHS family L-fucose permease-like MFS transporter
VAAWIQGRVAPALHLVLSASAATLCLFVIVFGKGIPAIVAVISIGFLVSIFFPTLYAMAIQSMGDLTGKVSGLLTMGFVGCAIIPVIQGKIADVFGLQHSYALGFIAYSFAGYYAFHLWRHSRP